MQMTRRRSAVTLLAAAGFLGRPSLAFAQETFPSRPIRVVVPFATGGGTDDFTRRFIPLVGGGIGERAVIENRAGGSTLLATENVARSRPDGYSILMQTNNFTINPVMHEPPPYDPVRDFIPISLTARVPHILVVTKDLPVRNVQELLAYARANPGKLNFGSAGIGTINHLAGELFMQTTSVRMEHVPYRSAGEYTTDLLAGRLQLVFAGGPQAIVQARSGAVRALALTTRTRPDDIQDVPTMEEAGVPGFDISSWYGFLVPANTPAPIVDKLAAEFRTAALSSRARSLIQSTEMIGGRPADFAAFINEDMERARSLLRNLNNLQRT